MMMDATYISAQTKFHPDLSILKEGVWVAPRNGISVDLNIHSKGLFATAYLTAEQVDGLIRALAAARVGLRKARP